MSSREDSNSILSIEPGEGDHRVLNRKLKFFAYDPEIGAGLPLWLPNGTVVRDELERFMRELEFEAGYARVSTPHLARGELYRKSGHLPYYADSMFPPMELPMGEAGGHREPYFLRPMNCPHHHKIFSSSLRSYRELPLRLAEYGQVYRYEHSGALSGLLRARGFCQNDAHIYCSREQAFDEVGAVLEMYSRAFAVLGISDWKLRLSIWDPHDSKKSEKFIADPAGWEWAEGVLRNVLDSRGLSYSEGRGEAAFYGPKIDVQLISSSGREETASTIQLDFSMAEKLDLSYVGHDGELHRPVIIHRAPLGSHERMIAFLMEMCEGAFPLWLAPSQVAILPVADRHLEAARSFERDLRKHMIRAEVDSSNDTVSRRLREALGRKVPYVIVLGDKELQSDEIAVRIRGYAKEIRVRREEFLASLVSSVKERRPQLELS